MALRKYLLARVRAIARTRISLARVVYYLARWSADARAAAYAPGGTQGIRARAPPLTVHL